MSELKPKKSKDGPRIRVVWASPWEREWCKCGTVRVVPLPPTTPEAPSE